jgi:hypothetical protein
MLPGHSGLPQVWPRRKRMTARIAQVVCRLLAGIRPGSPGLGVRYSADGIIIYLIPEQIAALIVGPFRLYPGVTTGDIGVTAGAVNTGDAEIAAAALAPVTVAAGDQFLLTITYNGTGGPADSAVISHVAAASVPTDFLSYTATADPAAGVFALIIVLGAVTATGFTQRWTGGDIILPKGQTYTRRAIYAMSYAATVFSYTYRDETFVNGQLYLVGAESTQNVFSTGPCP